MTDWATVRSHDKKRLKLRKLAAKFSSIDALGEDFEWEVVVLFYSALHLLSAYFCTKNPRFQASRHDQREKAINESPELRKGRFRACYKMLQDVSEQIRYEPGFVANKEHINTARSNLALVESFLTNKVKRILDGD